MLDNFSPEGVAVAARELKARWGEKVLVEVSGGLTEENVEGFASADVDIVSSSSIHQGVKHVDFSLKVVPKTSD
jgi:nicotinate-nucleotide pyrophosphorylase (carboxylating)